MRCLSEAETACVIPISPPCMYLPSHSIRVHPTIHAGRFCVERNLVCSFESSPNKRRSTSAGSTEASERDIKSTGHNTRSQLVEDPHGGDWQHLVHSRVTYPLQRGPQEPSITAYQESYTSDSVFANQGHLVLPPLHPSLLDPDIPSPTIKQRSYQAANQYPSFQLSPTSGLGHQAAAEKIESLETLQDQTAHFLGLASEQDTYLLSSFRSNILNETSYIDTKIRQVYPGNQLTGQPPLHFTIISNKFPEHDQRAKDRASDCIESYAGVYSETLIRLYFRFVHPKFPVLSKARFLTQYAENRLKISPALRGAVYGLAIAFWERDDALKDSFPIDQAKLLDYARSSLDKELDSPKLATLQACLLVLHEQPQPTGTTESPRVWALACQATACAQSLGLYRDPTQWTIEHWEKGLRKKLWWATYFTDKFSSICHGNPSHILDGDFDTSDLVMEDLSSDEDVTFLPCWHLVEDHDRKLNTHGALHFLETVKLAKLLSGVLKHS